MASTMNGAQADRLAAIFQQLKQKCVRESIYTYSWELMRVCSMV